MMLLALETSGASFSVAVIADTVLKGALFCATFRNAHSRHMIATIDMLLDRSGMTLGKIEAYAVDVGPGSFTGIRVGTSAIRAFAQLSNAPAVGVSALDVLARQCRLRDGLVMPVIPAVRGEVYAALYESAGGRVTQQGPARVLATEECAARVAAAAGEGRPVTVAGPAAGLIAAVRQDWPAGVLCVEDYPRAETLAVLGTEQLAAAGGRGAWEDILPLYIKLPQVLRA